MSRENFDEHLRAESSLCTSCGARIDHQDKPFHRRRMPRALEGPPRCPVPGCGLEALTHCPDSTKQCAKGHRWR